MIATELEIQKTYEGRELARDYIEERFSTELMRLLFDRQLGAVNQILNANTSSKALEIAPGPGRITRKVCLPGKLVCLEYNEGMIEEGKAACDPEVRWIRGNAFDLPFSEQFDFVYTFRFIRHFHHHDRARLYAQIKRVLRPGGILLFDAVNEEVSGPLRTANPEAYPIYDKLYRSEQEVRDELGTHGLEVLEIGPVQRWFGLQYRAQILLGPRSSKLCRLAIRSLERLRRGPALEWIVTCRRE